MKGGFIIGLGPKGKLGGEFLSIGLCGMRAKAASALVFRYSAAPMADLTNPSSGSRRSAVYSYLRPAITGRRVLEIGCGNGDTTALLVQLGAKSAVGAGSAKDVSDARIRHRDGALGFASLDSGSIASSGSFELVLVPGGADLLRGRGPITLSALLSLIAPGGHLVCVVENGDRGEGIPYFDVVDALAPHFSKVRMFGQTPFYAYGIAEFDEAAANLRVESGLADDQAEPTHYIALAGPDEPLALGYALVQIPSPDADDRSAGKRGTSVAVPATASVPPDSTSVDLRQKLTLTEGKAEGLVRVSRAQAEEIEELRARLRRTAEARADLDEEVRRLRHALIEADESVVNLTRKTTEEMTALAQRLTAGLRDGGVPSPAATEEFRRRESELAERESALSERDDRIAGLEVARQEALWRADAADDELGRARADLARLRSEHAEAEGQARVAGEAEAKLKAQEATIDEFRRAAAVHVEEVNRLRDAANEQASLVTELEEALRECERQLADKVAEAAQLQKMLTQVEDEERVRRSRLAELEGLMLRAERSAAQTSEAREKELAEAGDLRARLASCQAESDLLRARLAEAEPARPELANPIRDDRDAARLAELEAKLRVYQDRDHRLAELRAEAPDPEEIYERLFDLETQYQAATMAAARVPELEAKLAELEARVGGAR